MKIRKSFKIIKDHRLSEDYQEIIDRWCKTGSHCRDRRCTNTIHCQLCRQYERIRSVRGLLSSRIVRTNSFNWLAIFQIRDCGKSYYRQDNNIILLNPEVAVEGLHTDSGMEIPVLERIRTKITENYDWYNSFIGKVSGVFERDEITKTGVTRGCYSLSGDEIALLIEEVVHQESS